MQSNYKITVNLETMDIIESPITCKHEYIGNYELNYRLIYFAKLDCLYSRGIIISDESPLKVEDVQNKVDKARRMIEKRYNKVIFASTDDDCPAELAKMAIYC